MHFFRGFWRPLSVILAWFVGLFAFWRIAEKWNTWRHLREQQSGKARLMAVMELGNILVCDWEGRIVCWNAGCGRLYGYNREEAVGRLAHQLLQTEFSTPLEEIRAALRRAGRWQGELRQTSRDGRPMTVASEWVLWQDPSHHGPLILEVNTDITGQKRAENEIADTARRRLQLAEACARVLRQTEPQATFQLIVDAARQLTGAQVAACGHQYRTNAFRIDASSHAEGHAPCPPDRTFMVEKGGVYLEPLRQGRTIRLTDEEMRRHPAWWGLPPGHGALRGFLGVALLDADGQPDGLLIVSDKEDGSEFTEEDELLLWQLGSITSLTRQHLEARETAEAANRAKDDFLARLSHELRTPLTPVVLGLSYLQGKSGLDPETRKTLESISRHVETESRLINDLLDVMRIVRGKIELEKRRVTIGRVLQRAIDICRSDLEAAQLCFSLDLGDIGVCWLEADAFRLEQLFGNLLKNAIKFTPAGGYVAIEGRRRDGTLTIDIRDSGIGIEPAALPKVFEAFEQGTRSITRRYGGLGLGLAISRAIVELHGGAIGVHSEGRGRGATFTVQLPVAKSDGAVEPVLAEAADKVLSPLRILLVEDHRATADMIEIVLTEKGHAVTKAEDVAAALGAAGERPFDLLISDLGLPDGSGHELLRALREQGREWPAIALSGYGQEGDLQRSRQSGFARHVIKPASQAELLAAIAAVQMELHEGATRAQGTGEVDEKGGARADHKSSPATPADCPSVQKANEEGLDMAMEPHLRNDIFDFGTALGKCFGKEELLRQMVNYLYEDAEPLLEKMGQAAAKRDGGELARAAHRLKGTLVHLAAPAALQAAQVTEKAGLAKDWANAEPAVQELRRQVDRLKRAIEERGLKRLPPTSGA